jgi:hypothetical protein
LSDTCPKTRRRVVFVSEYSKSYRMFKSLPRPLRAQDLSLFVAELNLLCGGPYRSMADSLDRNLEKATQETAQRTMFTGQNKRNNISLDHHRYIIIVFQQFQAVVACSQLRYRYINRTNVGSLRFDLQGVTWLEASQRLSMNNTVT